MRMYVWAFGTQGDFLFGVPGEAFERLNGIYDASLAELQQDRHFANRQEFLRELIQSNEDLSFASGQPPAKPGEVLSPRWRHYRDDWRDHAVLSTPLEAPGEAVLGNLYMKIVPVWPPDRSSHAFEGLAAGGGAAMIFSGLFLWFLLPSWVYVDASERGVRRAALWSFLVFISGFVGLVVYLIARPEHPAVLECPGCGREINGNAFCPYCGRDVSTVFCTACRYPLKPDWTYCPSCRAEIKPAAEAAGPA
jgi:RNA polymerase subunit RPABC4/transcription elongation factor Spt4